jgi:two-component system, chemotaxis family, CheB/CheR fusion protein
VQNQVNGATEGPTAPSSQEPVSNSPPFLVAGIGASAGGLDAFTRVLQNIPSDAPLAVVLVQHLSRDHESLLSKLLGAKTALVVLEGTDGQRLVPGHVYVLQPNTHMFVIDGCLRVGPRPPGRQHDVPVDHLFESMAEQYRERAIGVILSGGGSDGSLGAQRIHAVGGIVLAQDPEEAQVDSMPRSAISTGSVDMVLASEQIAEELVRLAAHPFYQKPALAEESAPQSVEAELLPILRVLRRATGADFTRYKTPTIKRRIQRRMAIHRIYELPAYLEFLRLHADEASRLHDDILIHVTSFFRERESFDTLKQSVLPKLLELDRGDGPVRAWVPGCSSGEEAYSLAISLIEAMSEMKVSVPIVVFGTDLSQRMIEHARRGLYSDSIASEVSPEQLRRFFVKVDNGYRVSGEVRERCVFARQDITRDPPFSKLDIVMCRNLLIYLNQSAQRKLIGVFHYALLPHGALVLGRSETIGPLPELFSVLDSRWKVYQRKPGVFEQVRDFGVSLPEYQAAPASRFSRAATRDRRDRDLQEDANRVLLDRYVPPLVIVDDAFRVVRSQGRTAPYLELPSGEASLDLLKLVRPGLMGALRSMLHEVRASGTTLSKEGLDVRGTDVHRRICLEVSKIGEAAAPHYLVLFQDAIDPNDAEAQKPATRTSRDATLDQLQLELTETRASLQSMIQELEAANEELQAANEEILSSNEELQSTNEELDTAREECRPPTKNSARSMKSCSRAIVSSAMPMAIS